MSAGGYSDLMSATNHPAGRFDRFAERASQFVSKGAFFIISLLFVVIWIPTIAMFHSIDTWQLVINTVTSVMAFLLIALLQNSERRYDEALHRKVDSLAEGLALVLRNQNGAPDERERLIADLQDAVRLEERIGA